MLIDAVREARRQSTERIRLGYTNADVKIHMKLSMALTQAEDPEARREKSVLALWQLAQSAKDSLEMSCSLLQERVKSSADPSRFSPNFDPEDFPTDFDLNDIFGAGNLYWDGSLTSEADFN